MFNFPAKVQTMCFVHGSSKMELQSMKSSDFVQDDMLPKTIQDGLVVAIVQIPNGDKTMYYHFGRIKDKFILIFASQNIHLSVKGGVYKLLAKEEVSFAGEAEKALNFAKNFGNKIGK